MAELRFVLDEEAKGIRIGGYAVHQKDDEKRVFKVLGIFNNDAELFNIIKPEIVHIPKAEVYPLKLTIDGYNVAAESYRIFIKDLDRNFEYTLNSFHSKAVVGEKVKIMDIQVLNTFAFNDCVNPEVEIVSFAPNKKSYLVKTIKGVELNVKRSSFTRYENNIVQIAKLK